MPFGSDILVSDIFVSKPRLGKVWAMSGRGGPISLNQFVVDVGLLYECLEKHHKRASDLRIYEHISNASRPNGAKSIAN